MNMNIFLNNNLFSKNNMRRLFGSKICPAMLKIRSTKAEVAGTPNTF